MERADIGDLLVGQPRYRKDPSQRWSKQNTFRLFLGSLLLPISGKIILKNSTTALTDSGLLTIAIPKPATFRREFPGILFATRSV